MNHSARSRRSTAAALLATASGALALGATLAIVMGWFWVRSRGDWQAFALWGYWCGTPVLSGISLCAARRGSLLRSVNVLLLGVWAAASLVVLLLPVLQ